MEQETITKEEALKQGFTHCTSRNDEWSTLEKIEDINDQDIEEGYYLSDKEEFHPEITAKEISEILADKIQDDWREKTMDDTEGVYESVETIDFTKTADMINRVLKNHNCRISTQVKIVQ